MYMQYMTCTILYTCYMYYYECTTEKLLLYMWPVSHINQHRYTLPVPKSADAAASKKPFPGLQLSSAAALPWTRFPSEHPVLQFGTRQPARVCRLGRFPATRVPSVGGLRAPTMARRVARACQLARVNSRRIARQGVHWERVSTGMPPRGTAVSQEMATTW